MKSSSIGMSEGVHMSAQQQEATDEGLPMNPNERGATMKTFDASSDERVRRIAATPPEVSILTGGKNVVEKENIYTLQVDSCTKDLCSDSEDEHAHDIAMTEFDRDEWKVYDSSVRTVPLCYPLDKNSVFVRQSSALEIAERIQRTLRDRSIAASYTCQPDSYTIAKCVSRASVHFRVQLYRGRGEYKDGFIVEVQRRSGFDFRFQMVVMAILDSAQGIIEEADASFLQFRKNTMARRATMDCIRSVVDAPLDPSGDDGANAEELQTESNTKSLEGKNETRPRRSRRASLICLSSFTREDSVKCVAALDLPMEDNRKQHFARSA